MGVEGIEWIFFAKFRWNFFLEVWQQFGKL